MNKSDDLKMVMKFLEDNKLLWTDEEVKNQIEGGSDFWINSYGIDKLIQEFRKQAAEEVLKNDELVNNWIKEKSDEEIKSKTSEYLNMANNRASDITNLKEELKKVRKKAEELEKENKLTFEKNNIYFKEEEDMIKFLKDENKRIKEESFRLQIENQKLQNQLKESSAKTADTNILKRMAKESEELLNNTDGLVKIAEARRKEIEELKQQLKELSDKTAGLLEEIFNEIEKYKPTDFSAEEPEIAIALENVFDDWYIGLRELKQKLKEKYNSGSHER